MTSSFMLRSEAAHNNAFPSDLVPIKTRETFEVILSELRWMNLKVLLL
jgi:hypothetical protein